ncbi:hypothetical protein AGMMS4957_11490 [Bacteroidia bacterium]|nr:hypothetical protein AGMMS4957_11490 [Bacteroidia bacterium]
MKIKVQTTVQSLFGKLVDYGYLKYIIILLEVSEQQLQKYLSDPTLQYVKEVL